MNKEIKPVEKLQISDLKASPVWQYVNSQEDDGTAVGPVKKIPVTNLNGKLVGIQVQLADGNSKWALIGNVDNENPRLTEHFLTLSILHNDKWFTLSRYHDFDYSTNGPDALAKFIGLDVDQIFPITYDISAYVKGDSSALSGKILKEPKEKLTRAQIIAMAVP